MGISNHDSSEQLAAALSNGVDCMYNLVVRLDSGAPDLAVESSTWQGAMTALEWGMNELRTNKLVTSGYKLTEEDIARVRVLREQVFVAMQRGERSPELRQLAVESLETLCGPDWAEKIRLSRQGLPPT